MNSSADVTQLLLAWNQGDRAALDKLMPIVYDELRRLARKQLRSEAPEHTLQATVLVNEAYIRLVDLNRVNWQNRAHFFGAAAQIIRRVLVDHARARHRLKRGGAAMKGRVRPRHKRDPPPELAPSSPGRTAGPLDRLDAAARP